MTMHFEHKIHPKAMDPEDLDRLKSSAVSCLPVDSTRPVFPAYRVHELLCHLESVEKAMQEYAKTTGEIAAKCTEETRNLVALHSQTVATLNDTIADKNEQIDGLGIRIGELMTELDEAKARPGELRPGDPANPVPM